MFYDHTSYSQSLSSRIDSDQTSTKAERAKLETKELTERVERLQLACQAMWEVIRDTTPITEQDLEAKILEVDTRDGKVDGKISTHSLTCHACGKPTNSKRDRCVMCGAFLRRQHKFES